MKAKKNIKFLALGLMALLTFNAFAGCDAIGLGSNDSNSSIEQTNANVLQNKVVNDFSDIKDLYQVILENNFKADINKDQAYVLTSGASAKLSIGSDEKEVTVRSILKQRLTSQVFGYDYTDFTKVKKFKTQIYNPSDEARTMRVCIAFGDGKSTSQKIYTLKKGWNDIIYDVDRTLLSFQVDLSIAAYLQYSFDVLPMEVYDLYLDNISITQTNTPMDTIEMTVEKDEICYFEQNYQKNVFWFYTWSKDRIGDVADYGLTADPDLARTGTSLYVTTKKGEKRWQNWYYTRFSEAYLNVIDWESLNPEDTIEASVWVPDGNDGVGFDIDTKLGKITSYDVEEADPNDPTKTITKSVNIVTGKAIPKQWSTFSFKVGDMITSAKAHGFVDEKTSIWDIFTGFGFHWGEFVDVEEKTYYFDDFRVVRGTTQEGGTEE